jgi:hypothetical protein
MRQRNTVRIKVSESKESDDALGHTMNVQRISAIMEISGGTVFAEEVIAVELEAASNALIELGCISTLANGLQRAQVVSRVEVVNPSL